MERKLLTRLADNFMMRGGEQAKGEWMGKNPSHLSVFRNPQLTPRIGM